MRDTCYEGCVPTRTALVTRCFRIAIVGLPFALSLQTVSCGGLQRSFERGKERALCERTNAIVGATYCLTRTKDRALFCGGKNEYGQVGVGGFSSRYDKPQRVPLDAVASVSSSAFGTCAVGKGGLHCWGANWTGELAQPTYGEAYTKSPIRLPARVDLEGVTAVATSTGHA